MPLTEAIPLKGTYTLIIHLPREISAKIGKQGIKRFPKGYYTYTGSALGPCASSLQHRVSRHLRKKGKKKHWHIDFLLAHKEATVTTIIAGETDRKTECEMNRYIKERGAARIPVSGFGASDCKSNCQSHLLYFGEKEIKAKIVGFYTDKLGSRPVVIESRDKKSGVSRSLKSILVKNCKLNAR